MIVIFAHQNDILCRAFKRILKLDGRRPFLVCALIYRVNESCRSLCVLASMDKAADCYILARSIFEACLNISFICARGENVAMRAWRHALQRSHRNLDRRFQVNDRTMRVFWSGKDSIEESPEVKAALNEFTTKKGKEVVAWSKETPKEKMTAIDQKYGKNISIPFEFGYFGIYRHASDITHATLFGVLFLLGATTPTSATREDKGVSTEYRGQISTILMLLGWVLDALIDVLDQEFSLADLNKEANEVLKVYRQEPWLKDRLGRK